MPLVTATISGQLIRPDQGASASTVIIEAATDGGRITVPGVAIDGRIRVPVNPDGTASATIPTTDQTGLLPAGAKWRLIVQNVAGTYTSAPFELTADTTWDEIIETAEVPYTPSIISQVNQAAADAEAAAAAAQAVGATNDAIMAGVVEDTGSSTRTAMDGVYPAKGDSRNDGQNVKHLRRPTLVVDRMFPSPEHDHEIVWVDETNREAYAIGQDQRLRRSSWVSTNGSTDAARIFGSRIGVAPTGKVWCSVGTFLRIQPKTGLTNGAILLDERDTGQGVVTNTVLKRSTDSATSGGFMNFTTVWTAPTGVTLLGPQSISRDEVTGYLYLVEYVPQVGSPVSSVTIHRSTDDGATWADWFTYPRADDGAGSIRHWHSTRYDPVSQRVYFFAGDTNDDAGIWRVSDDGSTAEKVVTNSQIAAETGQTWSARCVDAMFTTNFICWPSDGSGGLCYVHAMNRDQIGQATPQVSQIATMNSTGWWTQRASDDGSMWVCCGSNESITGRLDKSVHVYAVVESGGAVTVDEVGAFDMEVASASTSISGLAAGSGGGDHFWMRGHNLLRYPNLTYSGFQCRAQLAWGAVPIQLPDASPRNYSQSAVGGVYSLTASQTQVIGHTAVPKVMKRLQVMDVGLLSLSGTGTPKVEVYNATTSTVLATYLIASGAEWRAVENDTSAAWVSQQSGMTAGDIIHLRLVETGGAAVTVSAHIRYGWRAP